MTTAKMNNICVHPDAIDVINKIRKEIENWCSSIGGSIYKGEKWPLIISVPKGTDKSWLRNILARYDMEIAKDIQSKYSMEYYRNSSGCCSACDWGNYHYGPKKVIYYII